jgi:hypothetical protein
MWDTDPYQRIFSLKRGFILSRFCGLGAKFHLAGEAPKRSTPR